MKKVLFYFILLLTVQQIQAQDILVLYGGQTSQLSQAQGYAVNLSNTGAFDSVDAVIWDSLNKYDINYLNAYDAIMVITNGGYNASYGMGDVLKTYVDNGGGVGIFLFANASIQIGGSWNYNALIPAGQSMGPTTFGTIDVPTHPALNYPFGINTATWNVGSLWSSTSTTLAPEAYSIAKFSDGRPGLQARENVGVNGTGRVIDFAVSPSAAFGSNTVTGYQLFANVMMWLTSSIQTSGDTCLATNNLSFSFLDDGGSPVVSYDWDFGDATGSSLSAPNKTYLNAGEFDISLTVVRQDASSNVYTDKVIIFNEPTPANAGDNQYLISGTTSAQLTGNLATVGEGVWSWVSGPNTPNSSITDNVLNLSNLVTGNYEYQWQISNGTCFPSADVVQILITDNTAPSDIAITSMEITENNTVGDAVGLFSATDLDIGDEHTFSLVAGVGDDDNESFSITDTSLVTAITYDYETKSAYSIRVRVTDRLGEFFEKSFQINILDTDAEDTDADGILDSVDNCKSIANPDQTDLDDDGIGDICDDDDDDDGVLDNQDNCPLTGNTDQSDQDSDGLGNVCDDDDDGDGTPDVADTFPLDEDEDTDTDGDGIGDNEDTDDDDDGTPDVEDVFPLDEDEDTDTDWDGIGDNEDTDDDDDGTPDVEDVFPLDEDEDTDTDGDGIGDNEDTDDDDDGIPDTEDEFPKEATDNDIEATDTDTDKQPLLKPAEAFTPNGDGINDTWVIPGISSYSSAKVTVYNRWGHEIFAAINYQNDWNGNDGSNSKKIPPGSYLYVIELGSGSAPIRGWLFINY